jgi:predicted RNase H-like nuclease (RuvC/YqgF family)
MKDEEMTVEEKIELFHRMQERHREETHELRQIIEEQRQTIENLHRIIDDRQREYESAYRRFLEWKYRKPKDEG